MVRELAVVLILYMEYVSQCMYSMCMDSCIGVLFDAYHTYSIHNDINVQFVLDMYIIVSCQLFIVFGCEYLTYGVCEWVYITFINLITTHRANCTRE